MPDSDPPPQQQTPPIGIGTRALRNTILVLSAKVVGRLVALVSVLYMIRWLGQDHYGTFSVLVNLTAIVSVVLDLGFNVLFVREGARNHAEIQRYMRNVMSLRLLMSIAALVILAALVFPLGLGDLLFPGFLLMVFTSYATLLRNGLYAVQQLGYEAIAVVLESVVLLGLILYGIHAQLGVAYFVWAYAIQFAFSCVYFAIVLMLKRIAVPGWAFEAPLLREWFWKGLPFALTFVLTILYFRIDNPLIFIFKGEHQAAWYGAAYKPIESLLFIPISFLSVVFPVLAVYHREKPAELIEAVNRFYKALLLMGWPTSLGIFVLAQPLTPLLLGPRLQPAEPAMRILALTLGLAFINNAFIGALNASDHQLSFTWAAGWSLVANLALNLTLIPLYGYQGASWATVATEFTLSVVSWILTARHVGRVPVAALSWRIILAGLVMAIAVEPFSNLGGLKIVIPIGIGILVYTVAVLLLRVLNEDEMRWARRALAFAR